MGTAFPMAEVISTYIPPSFYEAYYLYLYIGSMFFLLYMYLVLLRDKRKRKKEADATASTFDLQFFLLKIQVPNLQGERTIGPLDFFFCTLTHKRATFSTSTSHTCARGPLIKQCRSMNRVRPLRIYCCARVLNLIE